MTAEIAILNKSAVALAADSAATVDSHQGTRIYHGENKLFALSKYRPVGLMIFNSSELCGIPLETIIKIYRHKLGEKKFDTVEEYAEDFLKFLSGNIELFPIQQQEDVTRRIIFRVFFMIWVKCNEELKKTAAKILLNKLLAKMVKAELDDYKKQKLLENFDEQFENDFRKKYKDVVNSIAEEVFGRKRFPNGVRSELLQISAYAFSRKTFTAIHSGIVIAGFGQKDIMPSLRSYYVEAIVENRLKYHPYQKIDISHNKTSHIEPFANDQTVRTILSGLDPNFEKEFTTGAAKMVLVLSRKIIDEIQELDQEQKKQYFNKNLNPVIEAWRNYLKELEQYRKDTFEQKILDVIAVLPKDELAVVAQSLVNVTSFRQRISMQAETVGGPIDVAIISKGDGFVWINRKHYFDTKYNPHFISNYFRQD